jgi:hypothetical protein
VKGEEDINNEKSQSTITSDCSSATGNKQTNDKLTTWTTVLEKLTVTRLVKKFLAIHGTRKFITVLIRAHH